MNKVIEEMAKDICKGCQTRITPTMKCSRNCCAMSEIVAEALYNADYHKTVWHKVADGDLPKEEEQVCCLYGNRKYDVGKLITAWGKHKWDLNGPDVFVELNDVVAWTELPKYEGEG